MSSFTQQAASAYQLQLDNPLLGDITDSAFHPTELLNADYYATDGSRHAINWERLTHQFCTHLFAPIDNIDFYQVAECPISITNAFMLSVNYHRKVAPNFFWQFVWNVMESLSGKPLTPEDVIEELNRRYLAKNILHTFRQYQGEMPHYGHNLYTRDWHALNRVGSTSDETILAEILTTTSQSHEIWDKMSNLYRTHTNRAGYTAESPDVVTLPTAISILTNFRKK